MPDLTLYGLKNCDTCRKARKALSDAGHDVTLREVREAPLTEEERDRLLEAFGDALINRRSTTWRDLTEEERNAAPADLLRGHPALMKRPVIAGGGALSLGWDAAARASWGV